MGIHQPFHKHSSACGDVAQKAGSMDNKVLLIDVSEECRSMRLSRRQSRCSDLACLLVSAPPYTLSFRSDLASLPPFHRLFRPSFPSHWLLLFPCPLIDCCSQEERQFKKFTTIRRRQLGAKLVSMVKEQEDVDRSMYCWRQAVDSSSVAPPLSCPCPHCWSAGEYGEGVRGRGCGVYQ